MKKTRIPLRIVTSNIGTAIETTPKPKEIKARAKVKAKVKIKLEI